MSKKVLVSLIGKQTMPNLLIELEHGPFDVHILVATEGVKETAEHIKTVFEVKHSEVKIKIIFVDENSIKGVKDKITEELNDFNKDNNCEISFNFTGGTKQMSIGMYTLAEEKFKDSPRYYSHRNNAWQNYAEEKSKRVEYTKDLSIETYLKSLGMKYKYGSENNFVKTKDETNALFEKYKEFINDDWIKELRDQRNTARKNKQDYSVDLNPGQISKLENWNWPFDVNNKNKLSKKEMDYITGGWLEEWTYNNLPFDGDKKHSVKVYSGPDNNTENEFDVMCMRENKLYVLECKTAFDKNLAINTSYKSSALIKKFGIEAESVVVYLPCGNSAEKNLKSRCDTEGIKPCTPDDIINGKWIKTYKE